MAKVIAQEEILVDSEVKKLTPAIYNPASGPSASYAIIHAEGGAMRYLVNGQDPNPSLGALFEDGDIVELPTIYHINDFRIVKAGTDLGKLTVTYET
jgi:hypothetical protein